MTTKQCANYRRALDGTALKPCERFKAVVYCGMACQTEHWKAPGGHKSACFEPTCGSTVLTSDPRYPSSSHPNMTGMLKVMGSWALGARAFLLSKQNLWAWANKKITGGLLKCQSPFFCFTRCPSRGGGGGGGAGCSHAFALCARQVYEAGNVA